MIFNLLLFYAIAKKSAKAMENYKKVLYLGCITDFFLALWFFFFEPEHIVVKGYFFTITRGIVGHLSSPWAVWVYMPTLFLFYFSLGNALIQFIYRYLMVCWKVKFNRWMLLGLTLLVGGVVAAYPMQYVVYLIQRTTTDKDFAYLLNGTLLDFNGFIPPNGVIELFLWPNMFFIVIFFVFLAYCIIIVCGILIYFRIRKDSEMLSQDVNRYQKQISIVMTIEALIPVITVVFPICLDILLYLVIPNLSVPWEGQIIFILFSFTPLINPLIKLTIIGCYRKWIFDYLLSRKSSFVSLISSTSTTAVITLS